MVLKAKLLKQNTAFFITTVTKQEYCHALHRFPIIITIGQVADEALSWTIMAHEHHAGRKLAVDTVAGHSDLNIG